MSWPARDVKLGGECPYCLGQGYVWGDDEMSNEENGWEWDGVQLTCWYSTDDDLECIGGIMVVASTAELVFPEHQIPPRPRGFWHPVGSSQ